MTTTEDFERVYMTHYDSVFRYCLRRCEMQDALDAAAETFAVAWRRRDDLPTDQSLPWLYGTARRVVANQRRSTARRSRAAGRIRQEGRLNPGPEAQVVRREEEQEVLDALDRLDAADREIIRLAGWEDLAREDLAVVLGCSPNAASKRLRRALDHLAAELGAAPRAQGRFFHRERSST